MATIAELKQQALKRFAQGQFMGALKIYDAILQRFPLELNCRIRVADCLLAMGHESLAIQVYAESAAYAIRSGHPLTAIVVAKILENQGQNTRELWARLMDFYASGSTRIGKFAGRINLPAPEQEVEPVPSLEDEDKWVAQAAVRAQHCTREFTEYPALLHPIPLLSSLSKEAFERLQSTFVVHRVADGHEIIRQGEAGQSFFMVASGALAVFSKTPNGEENRVAELGENAIFGEMALISNQPRSATVRVIEEADVIELGRDSLRSLADELETVGQALHSFTRERLLKNLMARSPLFQAFTEVQAQDLLSRFTEYDVAGGTEIIHEGDAGSGLFVVLSGILEVESQGIILGQLKSGEVCGEMALVFQTPTCANVRAKTPATLLFLDAETVNRMISGVPAVADYLRKLASDRNISNRLSLGDGDTIADIDPVI